MPAETLPYTQQETDELDTSRVLSDAELIKAGAVILKGVLTPTGEQIETIAAEHAASEVAHITPMAELPLATMGEQVISRTPEQSTNQEKINEWIETMPMTVHSWFALDRSIPREYMGNGIYGNRYLTLSSQPRAPKANSALEKLRTIPAPAGLLEQGVSELITILPVPGAKFGEFSKDSPFANEDAVQINCENLGPISKNGLKGVSLKTGLILPKSEADQFQVLLGQNPGLMRELTERLMTEKFKAGESWDKLRPPYTEWAEVNGGINKVAVRTDKGAGADQSKILEF